MRAVQLSRFGGSEVLEVIDVPAPVPQAREVLIRIEAAGINFFEVLMRQDCYAVTPVLPMIFGVEVAGTVVGASAGVRVKSGSRVAVPLFAFGRGGGGYAEYISVDAGALIPIPDSLSFDVAVALMVQGLTALHAIRRSPPKDKTVLVTAAAGGVGSLLVQLAKRSGARRVIATASTEEKLSFVQDLGADIGVNYASIDWIRFVRDATKGEGADIIYDFVGGALTKASFDALAPRGELVFGALGRAEIDSDMLDAMFMRNQSLRGLALIPLLTDDNVKADLAELFALATLGELKAVIGGRYPLDQVSEAHRAIDERRTTGKIILMP